MKQGGARKPIRLVYRTTFQSYVIYWSSIKGRSLQPTLFLLECYFLDAFCAEFTMILFEWMFCLLAQHSISRGGGGRGGYNSKGSSYFVFQRYFSFKTWHIQQIN